MQIALSITVNSLEELGVVTRKLQELGVGDVATSVPAGEERPAGQAGVAIDQQALDRQVRRLKRACTKGTGRCWQLVHGVARNVPAGTVFGKDEMGAWSGMPATDAASRFRNLSKPCNRLNLAVFQKVPGSSPAAYTMDEEVKASILCAGV